MSKQGRLLFDERESLELLWEGLPAQGRAEVILLYASLIARGLRAGAEPSKSLEAQARQRPLTALPTQPIDPITAGLITDAHADLTNKAGAFAAHSQTCADPRPNN